MARPIKDEAGKLSERATVRMTPAEFKAVERDAVAAGLTVAELLRRRGIRNQREIIAQPKFSEIDLEAIRLLKRISDNMNQQAAALNAGVKTGKVNDAHAIAALLAQQETQELLREFFNHGSNHNRRG